MAWHSVCSIVTEKTKSHRLQVGMLSVRRVFIIGEESNRPVPLCCHPACPHLASFSVSDFDMSRVVEPGNTRCMLAILARQVSRIRANFFSQPRPVSRAWFSPSSMRCLRPCTPPVRLFSVYSLHVQPSIRHLAPPPGHALFLAPSPDPHLEVDPVEIGLDRGGNNSRGAGGLWGDGVVALLRPVTCGKTKLRSCSPGPGTTHMHGPHYIRDGHPSLRIT
eukprot:scaffold3951_cov121-Isochrysis_galbana.AAC.4